MRKRFLLILLLFAFTAPAFADVDINPGMWEITMEMKMPGMNMPPTTMTQCLTKEDLVPKSSSPNQNCELIDMKTSGNTVRWTMKCSGQGGESTYKGEVTYHGDTYEGTMVMVQGGTEVTMHMTGRRIGDCD